MEVAVDLGLDDRRAVAGAHVVSASSMARRTASGSMPSTRQLGMSKPSPRAESRGSAVEVESGVETAYRLFSMKKQTGSFQAAARLNDSSTEPMLTAPSPK